MIHFKIDLHAIRWSRMRESKLIDYLRYTFQPGFSVAIVLCSQVAIVAAALASYNIVGYYFATVIACLAWNYVKWKAYRTFK